MMNSPSMCITLNTNTISNQEPVKLPRLAHRLLSREVDANRAGALRYLGIDGGQDAGYEEDGYHDSQRDAVDAECPV